MSLVYLFVLILAFSVSGENVSIKPCRLTDEKCVEESANEYMSKIIVPGIPSMGIESSDPLFVERAEGNLSVLKFKFINTTITGFKTCKLSNIKLSLEASTLKFDMICSKFEHNGKYEIDGRLVILPVKGSGDYNLMTGKYLIKIIAEVKIAKGIDEKDYMQIKNFDVSHLAALEPIEFHFSNLFNGQKELSDTVHNFAKENWKEVSELVDGPLIAPDIKLIFSRVNKYLKTIPIQDLIIN